MILFNSDSDKDSLDSVAIFFTSSFVTFFDLDIESTIYLFVSNRVNRIKI